MKRAKIELVVGENGHGYFRVVAANGEIVAQSEGYSGGIKAARKGAKALIAAVASMAASAIVEA